jgi:hypothetical protein
MDFFVSISGLYRWLCRKFLTISLTAQSFIFNERSEVLSQILNDALGSLNFRRPYAAKPGESWNGDPPCGVN